MLLLFDSAPQQTYYQTQKISKSDKKNVLPKYIPSPGPGHGRSVMCGLWNYKKKMISYQDYPYKTSLP